MDQAFLFVTRTIDAVGWMHDPAQFSNVDHLLTVVVRRNRLVGIHTFDALRQRLQRRLDREPMAPLRRVSPIVLENAFLRGEAKGFWLRGTHPRRSTRPDTKNISGLRLQEAINPVEDSTFAMRSGRAALEERSSHDGTVVAVGTTMHKSLVWVKPSTTFHEFVTVTVQLFDLLEEVLSAEYPPERIFPLLAYETTDLSEVRGAFDVSILAPDDLVSSHGEDQSLVEAAELLQGAIIDVQGDSTAPRFKLVVGEKGSIGGVLSVRAERIGEVTKLNFGYDGEPSNPPPVIAIRKALEVGHKDLLSVYYRSGHAFVGGQVWHRQMQIARFPRWIFEDFSNFDFHVEKPLDDVGRQLGDPDAIHDRIGQEGDRSLFAWVLKRHSTGWLTCDDGSGEVADFVHISQEGVLSLIHVKGAGDSVRRRVSVGAYEVVASQASKNTVYTDLTRLKDRLESGRLRRPATWTDGIRVEDRSEFLDYLECLDPTNETRIVVVQPHLSQTMYNKLRDMSDGAASDDRLRLQLLETLLNSARTTIVASGAELYVVGSQF